MSAVGLTSRADSAFSNSCSVMTLMLLLRMIMMVVMMMLAVMRVSAI